MMPTLAVARKPHLEPTLALSAVTFLMNRKLIRGMAVYRGVTVHLVGRVVCTS